MKTFKFLIIVVFAGSMVPTIVLQRATPLPVRITACVSLAVGIGVGFAEIVAKRKARRDRLAS